MQHTTAGKYRTQSCAKIIVCTMYKYPFDQVVFDVVLSFNYC